MKKYVRLLIVIICISFPLYSQNADIPDNMFLYALIDEGIDSNGDSLISLAEARDIDSINLSYKNIRDLTGIEVFTDLIELDCSRNFLKELDLSKNAELEKLVCADNMLTDLNVSSNTALTDLVCDFNRITILDVSNCASLQLLGCNVNPLEYLDVSNNIRLKFLDCQDTRIRSLDVSNNPNLLFLRCNFNPLSYLDVLKNTSLRYFECFVTGLDRLDVSKNLDLAYLGCSFNQLSELNVSNNTNLQKLYCGYNRLINLDVSNNTALKELSISGMPSLAEICVCKLPFPGEGIDLYASNSPNIYFKDCRAPELKVSHIDFLIGFINVTSSEDGMVYIVPEGTEKTLSIICGVCLDSIRVTANSNINISIKGLENGVHWFYARDSTGNISKPEPIAISAVGIDNELACQIWIFPNPTYDLITVRAMDLGEYSVEIIATNGEIIYSDTFSGCLHQIDLSSFRKGVCLVKVKSKDVVFIEKLIIQ